MLTPSEIAAEVLDGNRQPLQALVLLKRLQADVEAALARIKDVAYTEFKNHGEKELTVDGATLSEYRGKTTYDYSEVLAVLAAQKRVKDEQARAKFAYDLISGGKADVVDGCALIDGELVKPCTARFSEPSVTVKP